MPLPSSFRDFYAHEFASQVRRAALILGDAHAAHDVVQSAFVRMSRRWDQVNQPERYLSRAVLNECRNEFRRRSRLRVVEHVPDRPTDSEYAGLDDVIRGLPWHERAVVVLRFYCDAPYREIARASWLLRRIHRTMVEPRPPAYERRTT